jgi:magnesium transporter
MLTLYQSRARRGERPTDLAEASLPKNVAWIDLLRPEPDEDPFVKRTTGLDVPSIADLSEIESYKSPAPPERRQSAPLVYRADSDQPLTTPVGFVLTRERLITAPRLRRLEAGRDGADRQHCHDTSGIRRAGVGAI